VSMIARAGRASASRAAKVVGTLAVTGLCIAYLVWKIDLGRTTDVLAATQPTYLIGALAIFLVSVPPVAWRWRRLLAARGVYEDMRWLTRTYLVSNAAAQVLPTSLGGDAVRIFEGQRRHPGRRAAFTGSVLLERAVGGVATLALAAAGFLIAIGRYDMGPYLWIEGVLVVAATVAGFLVFAQPARGMLALIVPAMRIVRLERPLRAAYEAVHSYRRNPGLLLWVLGLTVVVQSFRILAIWLVGKSVGVDLSPRPYYVMGPMLFLVMLVPFTINGVAVREAFFVSFLGKLGVNADAAFATGFLFFLLSTATALPGAALIVAEAAGFARFTRCAETLVVRLQGDPAGRANRKRR
jgi:glycosyltransferase 2 family protein